MHDERTAVSAHMFGLILKDLRERAGLTQRTLAKLALYDHTRISRAESGEILPPLEQAEALDRALSAGGLLVRLRQAAESRQPEPLHTGASGIHDGEPVILDMQTPDGRTVRVTISRRHFNQLLASGTLAAVLPALGNDPDQAFRVARAVDEPARVDAQVIDYFRRVLAEHYAADKMLGPRSLLKPVLAQIEVLEDLRRGARAAHVDPLLQVMAQYAEMAGWLHQDLGELQAAAQWSRRAAEWAYVAGDDQMAAYMMVRQSNIACLTDDHAAVVQYAASARRRPDGLEPKLLALAAQQQARGLAMRGEHSEAFALLDEAAETLRDHPGISHPNVPVYLHNYDLSTLEEQSAVCHRAAGRADTAVSILENKINALDENLVRDRGHLTAKLAVAVAQSPGCGDPGRAAHLGHDALAVAQQTGSARILRELRTLDTELLKHWPRHAEARVFHEALAVA